MLRGALIAACFYGMTLLVERLLRLNGYVNITLGIIVMFVAIKRKKLMEKGGALAIVGSRNFSDNALFQKGIQEAIRQWACPKW